MEESMKELYDGMTDEQKQRAKSLTTPEAMLKFAREEGFELTDAQLEGIAGGGFWDSCSDDCTSDCSSRGICWGAGG